jgi:hypothetical protein
VNEHLDELGAPRELGENSLDDNDLLESFDAVALRLEDLGHPPLTEALEEAITTERGRHPTPPFVFECHVATRNAPTDETRARSKRPGRTKPSVSRRQ